MSETIAPGDDFIPDWSEAPPDWNWCAQDADGKWYWYAVEPQPGIAGGIWRSPRRAQQFAGQGLPNAHWLETCRHRPSTPSMRGPDAADA